MSCVEPCLEEEKFTCHSELVSESNISESAKEILNSGNSCEIHRPTFQNDIYPQRLREQRTCHPEFISESQTETPYSPISLFPRPLKRAFTLAEVLITLGIIGIVAAMTLPALVGKYKKAQTLSQLQKVYANLNTAMRQSEADNESSEYWGDASGSAGSQEYFNKYWKPYLKIITVCQGNRTKSCSYSSARPWKKINGQPDEYLVVLNESNHARYSFILADGTFVSIISGSGYDNNDRRIIVDLNGSVKPNIIGMDTFLLTRVPGKGILPYGYEKTESVINRSCTSSGNGYMCAAKIIKDGWEMKKDYPW